MSSASHYAEVRAKFFPRSRPIVTADPALWRPISIERPPVIRRLIPIEPVFVPPPRSRIAGILKLACAMFGISKAVLIGDSRDALAVKARTYAAYRLFHELGLSKSHVGVLLHRDHSSIWHILDKAGGGRGKIPSKQRKGLRRE